jgi:hypothetical protein
MEVQIVFNCFTHVHKLRGLSPRANYTDRATAACWRSYCQLLRTEGATWSVCHVCPLSYLVFQPEDGSDIFLRYVPDFQQTTWRYIPENRTLHHNHSRKNYYYYYYYCVVVVWLDMTYLVLDTYENKQMYELHKKEAGKFTR